MALPDEASSHQRIPPRERHGSQLKAYWAGHTTNRTSLYQAMDRELQERAKAILWPLGIQMYVPLPVDRAREANLLECITSDILLVHVDHYSFDLGREAAIASRLAIPQLLLTRGFPGSTPMIGGLLARSEPLEIAQFGTRLEAYLHRNLSALHATAQARRDALHRIAYCDISSQLAALRLLRGRSLQQLSNSSLIPAWWLALVERRSEVVAAMSVFELLHLLDDLGGTLSSPQDHPGQGDRPLDCPWLTVEPRGGADAWASFAEAGDFIRRQRESPTSRSEDLLVPWIEAGHRPHSWQRGIPPSLRGCPSLYIARPIWSCRTRSKRRRQLDAWSRAFANGLSGHIIVNDPMSRANIGPEYHPETCAAELRQICNSDIFLPLVRYPACGVAVASEMACRAGTQQLRQASCGQEPPHTRVRTPDLILGEIATDPTRASGDVLALLARRDIARRIERRSAMLSRIASAGIGSSVLLARLERAGDVQLRSTVEESTWIRSTWLREMEDHAELGACATISLLFQLAAALKCRVGTDVRGVPLLAPLERCRLSCEVAMGRALNAALNHVQEELHGVAPFAPVVERAKGSWQSVYREITFLVQREAELDAQAFLSDPTDVGTVRPHGRNSRNRASFEALLQSRITEYGEGAWRRLISGDGRS